MTATTMYVSQQTHYLIRLTLTCTREVPNRSLTRVLDYS